jgi:hypothetical protein
MRRTAIAGLGLFVLVAGSPALTRAQTDEQVAAARNRPVRVANINLALGAVGFNFFDHPHFSDDVMPSFSYARRVFRRESRAIPIWLRGALGFVSEDRNLQNAYTVYAETDPEHFTEDVHEHQSDFQVRGEILADLLARPHGAIYGGVGFAVHALSFSSDGKDTRFPIFTISQNVLGPSAVAGLRLFTAKQPWTIYSEARYGYMYGRNDPPPPHPWLTDQTFDFTHVSAWTIEVGGGVHW